MSQSTDRVAPQNIDAEQGLLASCMMENGPDIITECLAVGMTEAFFYRSTHRILFDALVALYRKGIVPEEIVLANYLQEHGQLDRVGGHAYLLEITSRIETTVHARHWLNIVREKYLMRQLIRASQWTVEQAHAAAVGSADELLGNVEAEFLKIQSTRITDGVKPMAGSLDAASQDMMDLLNGRGGITGVPSGFIDLDRYTYGFQPGEMIVIAARPSMGKTAIGVNIAENASMPCKSENRAPAPSLIFSLEMTDKQLAQRMICSEARIDMQRLREGYCDRKVEMVQAVRKLKDAPLWVDASSNLNTMEIRARARRLHLKNKIKLIIVDYLQLVRVVGSYSSREQEVAEISRSLKALAKELNIPVIVLCQLNRESEKEKRLPRMSDLRESGSTEQDADVILLLSKSIEGMNEPEQPDQVCVRRELVIAKNRNGPVGTLPLIFNKRLTRFENYTAHAC